MSLSREQEAHSSDRWDNDKKRQFDGDGYEDDLYSRSQSSSQSFSESRPGYGGYEPPGRYDDEDDEVSSPFLESLTVIRSIEYLLFH